MIRLATIDDLPEIMEIFATARKFMEENGNPTQWGALHPREEILVQDIEIQQLYVYVDKKIHGVFVLQLGIDAAYESIEGAWIAEGDYVTIHRIASSGKKKGVFDICCDYVKSKYSHIRIDTHEDNAPMRHLIAKNGFVECGIVYMDDSTPRIAYEYIR